MQTLISVRYRVRRNGICPSLFGSSYLLRTAPPGYSSDAQQIAGGHREFELLIDPLRTTKHGLPKPADGLTPAERFLDTLADDLAQAASG